MHICEVNNNQVKVTNGGQWKDKSTPTTRAYILSGVSNPGVGYAEWIHYLDSTITDFSSRERFMASPNIV